MQQHLWKDTAACLGIDTNTFFEKYEDSVDSRSIVDSLCKACPVSNKCFAVGVTGKEWGVWGGIYLEEGEISKEFNSHKSKKDWGEVWKVLTTETN
jgi:Transcription factor WhiB